MNIYGKNHPHLTVFTQTYNSSRLEKILKKKSVVSLNLIGKSHFELNFAENSYAPGLPIAIGFFPRHSACAVAADEIKVRNQDCETLNYFSQKG